MPARVLPGTDLKPFPLSLGGNVFGWTANRAESIRVLDAYAGAGGNLVDTADVYSQWVPGHDGGESERIIGYWLAARRNRDRIILATKVGTNGGIGAANVRAAAEASLRRLRTDRVDLLYLHVDDRVTPPAETLDVVAQLRHEGKVRHVAVSNYAAERLALTLREAERQGFPRPVALQVHYNLVVRHHYEDELRALCTRERIACVPYFALAAGFLTGKYRTGARVDTQRSAAGLDGARHLGEHGLRALAALDDIAAAHATSVAAVALAWLIDQPTVATVTASARTPAQLAELLPAVDLRLEPHETKRLTRASDVSAL